MLTTVEDAKHKLIFIKKAIGYFSRLSGHNLRLIREGVNGALSRHFAKFSLKVQKLFVKVTLIKHEIPLRVPRK